MTYSHSVKEQTSSHNCVLLTIKIRTKFGCDKRYNDYNPKLKICWDLLYSYLGPMSDGPTWQNMRLGSPCHSSLNSWGSSEETVGLPAVLRTTLLWLDIPNRHAGMRLYGHLSKIKDNCRRGPGISINLELPSGQRLLSHRPQVLMGLTWYLVSGHRS